MTLLCRDHAPVIENLTDKVHIGDTDAQVTAEWIAFACKACFALNHAPAQSIAHLSWLEADLNAAAALAAATEALLAEVTAE